MEETADPVDDSPWKQLTCQAICDRLNAGRSVPVVYLQVVPEVPPLGERLALFAAADIMLQTPLREGVSLFPFEFCLASAQTHGFSMPTSDEIRNLALANDDADSSLTTESQQVC